MALVDTQGRVINYLRLSVTDRCNMRCSYCMPPQGISKVPHDEVLTYEQLHRIARVSVASGIEKIRITGGEPLVRSGIVPFLHRLAELPGLQQLVLTTNGLLLGRMAADLRAAGVQRLNISLDSLRPGTFSRITRCGELRRVREGIEKARSCGFPVKINMVVMRGVNDDELEDFAGLAAQMECTVRFIEYMPAIREPGWQGLVLPGSEILARLAQRHNLLPVDACQMGGPARIFRMAGTTGTVGIITPISQHFCSSCNRIRVTSTGSARGCLFDETRIDLKPALRQDSDLPLAEALRSLVRVKPPRHQMTCEDCEHDAFSMASIGG